MEALYDDNRAPGGATHGYAGHAARLDLPRTGPAGCPSVYSVVYGNVGVLSLDANDLSAEIPTNAGYSQGAQLTWLTQRLGELRADPDVDFVVAFFHHCAYATSAAHASDAGVRAALAPLFDRFAVDLVVQGHNHQYERTDPIRGGVATRAAPDGTSVEAARDGTTYICCGSGGRPRYTWQPGEIDSYRGAQTPARPVTSYVAGAGRGEDPRDRRRGHAPATSTTPSCPCTSRRPPRADRDDERAGGDRRRPGDRPGRPGARPAAGDPRVAAVGARPRGLAARRAHRLHVGQPVDHGSGFGGASR